ncbi:hypothetical protein WN51_09668 [Melipona quadrifasciata]|uniref:Uncharacterized protein n=1 Tax=Melipona quadrifasciata TaxID=166423 RepID=A0A0M9A6A7_9HYME|nr:hypothetical protein WN51_09668 [Melipona quadrifasciata]
MLSRWQDDDRCPCSEKQGLALSVQLWSLLAIHSLNGLQYRVHNFDLFEIDKINMNDGNT